MNKTNFLAALLILVSFYVGSSVSFADHTSNRDLAEPFSYVEKRLTCAPAYLVVSGFFAQGYQIVGASVERENENDNSSPITREVAVLVHPLTRQMFIFETRDGITCIAASGENFLFHPEILAKNSPPI